MEDQVPIDFHADANRRTYSDREVDESWRSAVRVLVEPAGAWVFDIGCGIYTRAWHDLGAAGVIGVSQLVEELRRRLPEGSLEERDRWTLWRAVRPA